MPHHLGLQATNWDRALHHWSQIHRSESFSSRRYSIYLSPTWDPTPGQDQVSRPRCTLHHHLFEDNEGALALARCPKMRPRTKHLCLKYHHFREQHVRRGLVIPEPIDTKEQTGGIFTKALPRDQLQYVRWKLCGWCILQHPCIFTTHWVGFCLRNSASSKTYCHHLYIIFPSSAFFTRLQYLLLRSYLLLRVLRSTPSVP